MEDEVAEDAEEESPEKLKQSFLDTDAKDRAKFKAIYNYNGKEQGLFVEDENESDKGDKGDKGDER